MIQKYIIVKNQLKKQKILIIILYIKIIQKKKLKELENIDIL